MVGERHGICESAVRAWCARCHLFFKARDSPYTYLSAGVCRARGHFCLAPDVTDSVRSPG
jgi:hypothetical protein